MQHGLQVHGYYWVVTCKRCELVIKLAAARLAEHLGKQYSPHVTVACPRCRGRFCYRLSEAWKQKVYAR